MADLNSIINPWHHATVFGLLCKNTKAELKNYNEILIAFTKEYGYHRGNRMAQTAEKSNLSLNIYNYNLLCEWHDYTDSAVADILYLTPNYKTAIKNCPWHTAWEKYNLTEFGESYYCKYIDKYMLNGFNKELKLELSSDFENEQCCTFCWDGLSFKDKSDLEKFAKQKLYIKEIAVKDFVFHIKDMLNVFSIVIKGYVQAEVASNIICNTLKDFEDIFGNNIKNYIF